MYGTYIGIDPGLTGAICIISTGVAPVCIPMPLLASGEDVDAKSISSIIHSQTGSGGVFVVIEKSQAMPGQGVTSMFSYGRTYGKLLGVLEIMGVPFEEIHPTKWKKATGLVIDKNPKDSANEKKKKLKAASAALAIKLFPSCRKDILGPRGGIKDGIAEALLLAEYGRRIYK